MMLMKLQDVKLHKSRTLISCVQVLIADAMMHWCDWRIGIWSYRMCFKEVSSHILTTSQDGTLPKTTHILSLTHTNMGNAKYAASLAQQTQTFIFVIKPLNCTHISVPPYTTPAPAAWGARWFRMIDDADWEADHLGAPRYQGRKSHQPTLMISPRPIWQNPQ